MASFPGTHPVTASTLRDHSRYPELKHGLASRAVGTSPSPRDSCPSCCSQRPSMTWLLQLQHVNYSITASARASSEGGTVMPSALAVLRLITSSYLVGACTGMSAGFSPLRMRST